MSACEIPAGFGPLVFLLVAALVVAVAVDYEPRTPCQKQVDALARAARAREKRMRKHGWDR